jgi:hypothetical protein
MIAYEMKMKQTGKRDNEPATLARSADNSASSWSGVKLSITKREWVLRQERCSGCRNRDMREYLGRKT